MATLVQFLAAGVKGAESGTATFLARGTASSAAAFLYNDFERTAQPGTNVITLDANGAAEVYCSIYCDVTLRNSAGTILRTVTIGNSSSLLEVRSSSFTGDDYSGGTSATTLPITLTNVLNKWDDSAGAPDWKVLLDGSSVNLATALAGFAGIFINVKDPQYGAVGDGVTSDTTAVLAAISDAASVGGIVIFPPGTYLMGPISITPANICLLGFGQAILKMAAGMFFTDATASGLKVISGFRFEGTGAGSEAITLGGDGSTYRIDDCTFDGTGFTDSIIELQTDDARVFITRSRFTLSAAAVDAAIREHNSRSGSECLVTDCQFIIPSGFTQTVLIGSCFGVVNCVFDASAVTSGTYHMINPEDQITSNLFYGRVSNCTFIDGGSSGYVFDLSAVGAGSYFVEEGNSFIGFMAPTLVSAGHIYRYLLNVSFDANAQVILGSRRGRTVYLTNSASATYTADAAIDAETVVIEQSNSALTVTVPATGVGLEGRIIVFVAGGEPARSVTFLDSSGVGAVFNSATLPDENILSTATVSGPTSCTYAMTMTVGGTKRSLITSETNHHT